MRSKNSAKNILASLCISFTMTMLGFLTRKVFVDQVGIEYLGLNGLLQNILGIMSLLEGGFATSVVYNLYKPLADNDRPRILALIQLYKKVYLFIAGGIIIIGICIFPFIRFLILDYDNLKYVNFVYFIYLFNSIIGYFVAYRWALINASQQSYKMASINLSFYILMNVAKLIVLYYTCNYILFLLAETVCLTLQSICVIRKSNSMFPYLCDKNKYSVTPDIKRNIIVNMKALFVNQLGGFFMHSTDNIIISSFIGVTTVGLYSNYTLVISTISSIIKQILGGFSDSVGDLIASNNDDKIYEVFQVAFFVNFLAVSIPSIILFNAITPFISWWLGDNFTFGYGMTIVILLNFYIDMMRSTSLTFKIKSGSFVHDKYTPLFQGIINIILSLLFVRFWGLSGILFATTLSLLSIGFWQFPRLCYKYIFKQPLLNYFKKYAYYTFTSILAITISHLICTQFSFVDKLIQTIANTTISILVILVLYILMFSKLKEFARMKAYIQIILNNSNNNSKSNNKIQ